ncbi:MAG: CYTH domain-containing protein, partial [Candidatus Woesearchaeota archaeon]|nr:CYTH domain-containing protein [Candidatus Woesearchaeota archaeon]
MIEVELRSFLTEEEYERLLRYFDDHDIKEDKQESWYFDTEEDLRILRGEDAAKIWLKRGKMHDEFREEI